MDIMISKLDRLKSLKVSKSIYVFNVTISKEE